MSGYNLYRSSAANPDYQLITSLGSDVNEYTDTEVINGETYYYYVTTDYSPAGTESGPSNIADGTPVEWVELSISDGAALSGYTDTLEISITNSINKGPYLLQTVIHDKNNTKNYIGINLLSGDNLDLGLTSITQIDDRLLATSYMGLIYEIVLPDKKNYKKSTFLWSE